MEGVTTSPGLYRALPVPDGLEGQRVDQALSRLFGLTRTAAAEVADAGNVVVDGRVRGKGDRLTGGSWLGGELPPPPGGPGGAARVPVTRVPAGGGSHPRPPRASRWRRARSRA